LRFFDCNNSKFYDFCVILTNFVPTWVKDIDGTDKLDSHGHKFVDHDLYNHEGLTKDGIAEAFIEFSKKEGLSFLGKL